MDGGSSGDMKPDGRREKGTGLMEFYVTLGLFRLPKSNIAI